jgi:hypothetical protein
MRTSSLTTMVVTRSQRRMSQASSVTFSPYSTPRAANRAEQKRRNAHTAWASVPLDVIPHILKYLDFVSFLEFQRICVAYRRLTQGSLWSAAEMEAFVDQNNAWVQNARTPSDDDDDSRNSWIST